MASSTISPSPDLQNNQETRDWLSRTTVLLQESLRDFIVGRYRTGTLKNLTEPELRRAAFDSHPRAVLGVFGVWVLWLAPELLPLIVSIPAKEFNPLSQNFTPTIEQVFITMGMTGSTAVGLGAAALMPAHSGFLRNAMRADQENFERPRREARELESARAAILSGKFDNIVWLNALTNRLNMTQYSDGRSAQIARELIALADGRKREVAKTYHEQLQMRPDLKDVYDKTQPGWWQW